MKKIKSLYIHIPFCSNICSYCDFCKMYYDEKLVDKYLDALEYEIDNSYKSELLETIYIGGGTPSCLSLKQLNKLFTITSKLKLEEDYEFTVECNLDDITEEKLEIFKENGINRISIGIQTFSHKLLKLINRTSDYNLAKEKIDLIKQYGISNINVDLMYAMPGESLNDVMDDLDKVLSLKVPHISTYSLIIEPHTMFYINKVKNIDEDLDYEMYNCICNKLEKKGYKHYEISNFALEGHYSNHNLVYWNNKTYYGFGLGASGYIDNIRYTNTRNLNKYINHEFLLDEEELEIDDIIVYEMILGLRKLEGINKEEFVRKYNKKIEDVYDITKLIDDNKLIDEGNFLRINKDYIYTSNDILIDFIKE